MRLHDAIIALAIGLPIGAGMGVLMGALIMAMVRRPMDGDTQTRPRFGAFVRRYAFFAVWWCATVSGDVLRETHSRRYEDLWKGCGFALAAPLVLLIPRAPKMKVVHRLLIPVGVLVVYAAAQIAQGLASAGYWPHCPAFLARHGGIYVGGGACGAVMVYFCILDVVARIRRRRAPKPAAEVQG